MKIHGLLVPAMAGAILLAACSKEPPPPPAPTGPTAEELEQMRLDSIRTEEAAEAARLRAEEEAARRAEAERQRRIREAHSTVEEMVFFDFDMSDIRADAEQALRRKIPILRNSPDVRIRMEGHADERGSTEYNLALGSRRAESVREFLTGFGIDADRFTTTSFGEERPLVNRSSEEAWARNRRVEFVITGGEVQISGDQDKDRDRP
jgi:peptidoglycan-associated lipoprotein